jgi:hypothetical protein
MSNMFYANSVHFGLTLNSELRLSPRFSFCMDVGVGYNTSTKLPVADMNFLLGYRLNIRKHLSWDSEKQIWR